MRERTRIIAAINRLRYLEKSGCVVFRMEAYLYRGYWSWRYWSLMIFKQVSWDIYISYISGGQVLDELIFQGVSAEEIYDAIYDWRLNDLRRGITVQFVTRVE